MASLAPGTLSNLLQNVNNNVSGSHRTSLLQVIGIVPKDDVFEFNRTCKGFYLRVSDSVHSAYVGVGDDDVEKVLSNEIQLGGFVYVTRLISGSPVPVLCGVKVVKKRRGACVGEPKDLISSDVLVRNGNGNGNGFGGRKEGRRLSLDTRSLSLDYSGSRKGWDRSPGLDEKHRRSGSDVRGVMEPSSPMCSTPASLVKDFVLKPPNLNLAPLKSKNVIVSDVKSVEPQSPLCSTPVRSARKATSVKDFILKPPNLNLAPLRSKNVIVPEKLMSKPIKKDLKTSFDSIPVPSHLTKVPISSRTWSDSKIYWDAVSPTIGELGKEAICRRNLGFLSAVHALEETSAMENILQCMSVFADICKLAETSGNPLVEQFLNFYQKLQAAAAVVNTLIDSKSTVDKTIGHPSNSALWVQAALETNFAKFTLLKMEENRDIQNSERNYHVLLESPSQKIQVENRLPENKRIPRNQEPVISKVRCSGHTMKKVSSEMVDWSEGSGLKDTANLAEKLILVSRKWFLKYLEDSLNKGFGLTKGKDSGVAVGLLGQLRRVNQWLDNSVRGDQKVENLRKKLYRFLLDHVQKAAR